ncbi:unnamed protein product [Litomosoides sigmodontis]|uniref:Uncharacterized protein n=1 Tax=Litomosoides sigmodontis TaxID=42156 RepID=A0A3P6TNI9_LITSI|nr:unnamed protein product [Litomosoides sigmodontis]
MADCLLLNTLIKSVRAGRSRSRRPSQRDHDQGSVVLSNSISTHKSGRYSEALVNGNKVVAFPNVAMYESSYNDVVYIKSQLLELRKLINDSTEVQDANKSVKVKIEDNDVIERLLKENDALRKELVEKDRTIDKLKAQMLLH